MSSQQAISQAIDALIKSGKEEGNPLTLPGLNTIDIYPMFEHAFSEKAKATLAVTADSLFHQYNRKQHEGPVLILLGKLGLKSCLSYAKSDPKKMYVRDFDLVRFASLRATKDKLPQAIEKVIATVNHVADLGFTRATMVKLSLIELHPIDRPELEYAVISYITLSKKGAEYVKQNMPEMFVEEGGMPMRIE